MKHNELIRELGTRYGQAAVIIRSQYHIQVKENGNLHNVWFTKHGNMKWQLDGQRRVTHGHAKLLLEHLAGVQTYRNDMQSMRAALEMCEMIGTGARRLADAKVSRAVFCDAGLKNGVARVGVLLVDGDTVQAVRRNIEAATIQEAERMAIVAGIALADSVDHSLVVFSDNKSVAESFGSPRVRWIPRTSNKGADALANLRTKG
jgi:hypothetical protein